MPQWGLQTANMYQPKRNALESVLSGVQTGLAANELRDRNRAQKQNYLAKMREMQLDEQERERAQGRFDKTYGLNEKTAGISEKRLNLDQQKYVDEQEKSSMSMVRLPDEKPAGDYTDEDLSIFTNSAVPAMHVYAQRINKLGPGVAKELVTAVENIKKLTDPKTTREEKIQIMDKFRGYHRELIGPEKLAELQAKNSQPKSTLGKLIDDYNKEPGDSQFKDAYKRRIEKELERTGERISIDPDTGKVVIERGGAVGPGIPDKTMNRQVTEKLFNSTEQLRRLDEIGQEVAGRPELMDAWTRLESKIKSVGERLGVDPSPEDKKQMADIRSFQRKAIENINTYIKEVTGAQMSEKEADRIRLAQPDPGEGIWPKESYTEFMTSLNDARKQSKLSIARYQYLLREGFSPKAIEKLMEPIDPKSKDKTAPIDTFMPIQKFRDIVEKRMDEIETNNPGITEKELAQKIREEFYGK